MWAGGPDDAIGGKAAPASAASPADAAAAAAAFSAFATALRRHSSHHQHRVASACRATRGAPSTSALPGADGPGRFSGGRGRSERRYTGSNVAHGTAQPAPPGCLAWVHTALRLRLPSAARRHHQRTALDAARHPRAAGPAGALAAGRRPAGVLAAAGAHAAARAARRRRRRARGQPAAAQGGDGGGRYHHAGARRHRRRGREPALATDAAGPATPRHNAAVAPPPLATRPRRARARPRPRRLCRRTCRARGRGPRGLARAELTPAPPSLPSGDVGMQGVCATTLRTSPLDKVGACVAVAVLALASTVAWRMAELYVRAPSAAPGGPVHAWHALTYGRCGG